MRNAVVNFVGRNLWLLGSTLTVLLVVCLAGKFGLDYWIYEKNLAAQRQISEGEVQASLNQSLIIKLKDAELAYNNYLTTGEAAYRYPFNVNKNQAIRSLEQIIGNTSESSALAIYTRAKEMLSSLFDKMGGMLEREGDFTQLSAEISQLQAEILSRNNEISSLLHFIQVLEDERNDLLSQEINKLGKLSFLLNTIIATLGLALIMGLSVGLRKLLVGPLLDVTKRLGNMDEANTQPIDSHFAQTELQRLVKSFNNLIGRLKDRDTMLEAARQNELKALQTALAERVEYSSVLAHEIRTPLTTIIGLLELIGAQQDKNSCGNELEQIKLVSHELLELVSSTLEFSENRTGSHSILKKEPISLNSMIKYLELKYLQKASKSGVNLRILGLSELDRVFHTDVTKLQQICSNLIDNAVKFSKPRGKVLVRFLFDEGYADSHLLVVEVIDLGIGIKAAALDTIFEPFKQADSGIKRQFGGTGLGLALCKNFAERLGGTISVASHLGSGSIFRVELPIIFSQPTDELTAQSKPNETPLPSLLKGVKALMVEDHELNAKINSKLLAKLGLEIDLASTGEQALEMVTSTQSYDLILMDINLGSGLSGLEVTKCLHEKYGNACPPIIALTAGVVNSQREAIYEAGLHDIIEKPFNIDAAVTKITDALLKYGTPGQTKKSVSV